MWEGEGIAGINNFFILSLDEFKASYVVMHYCNCKQQTYIENCKTCKVSAQTPNLSIVADSHCGTPFRRPVTFTICMLINERRT